ncbi:M13 family metallopeptidase [Tessaracoccus sp. MC1756]|uniref:M13 family metallopeptidase n=1 Tax=Tessaracoccus sp. MC1756 TaxID=2760311 RepID=UPI0015FFA3CA|nr:M13-type metalloendopeptidase [Tessaracoccus sp. MC1756]MBB1508673.1 peptidase M13 [Tessaracoccus sp. MC1756]
MTPAIDFEHSDPAVRPQDDLFRHVNGTWLRTATIEPDQSSAGGFVDLRNAAELDVRAIVEEQQQSDPTSDEGRIAALYASSMDTDRIEALGIEPVRPILDTIDAIDSPVALARHLGWSLRHGLSPLVHLYEESDPGDPSRYAVFASQGGLGLPDEAYYRLEEHGEIREKYLAHLTRVFELAGFELPEQQAQAVLAVETEIASHHWDRVRCRDLRAMYNPTSLEDVISATPGFDWDAFLEGAEIPRGKLAELIVSQPSFLEGVAPVLVSAPLDTWRSWARWKALSGLSAYLSEDFVEARFDFYEKTLAGNEEQRPRWKRGLALVEGVLGEAVGRLYVERHFKPEAKAAMDELVGNLMRAYANSITKLTWMTEETRAEALRKLSKFTPKIGYPVKWRDYSALPVTADDLVANVLAANSFELDYTLERIGGPVDRDEWQMFPQTVNAYYHPLRNEIVFPAAILQPPFFNADADDAVNYGAIGAVIGHEIGHGFDDKGSTCDGDGRLRDWWQPADREAFEALAERLIGQYEGLIPEGIEGAGVNGRLTVGENIGDLGGLGIAYDAWLLAGGDPHGEAVDGLTPAQRFFTGWAQAWRGKRRPEAMKVLLATDPHSPNEFRCNQIVRNLDAFYGAFEVSDDDALWLAPEDRVTIW